MATKTAARPAFDADAVMGSSAASVARKMLAAMPGEKILEVPLQSIAADPGQPRRKFDQAALDGLAANIKTVGVIQPIVLRENPGLSPPFILVSGERRWRASLIAERKTVPAVVRAFSEQDLAKIRLIQASENSERVDLDLSEKARQCLDFAKLEVPGHVVAVAMNLTALKVSRLKNIAQAGGHVEAALNEGLCSEIDTLYELSLLQDSSESEAAAVVAGWRDPERGTGSYRVDVRKARERLKGGGDKAAPAAVPADQAPQAADLAGLSPATQAPATEVLPESFVERSPATRPDSGDDHGAEPASERAKRPPESKPKSAGATEKRAPPSPARDAGLQATPEVVHSLKATGDVHQVISARIDGDRVLLETDRGTYTFTHSLISVMGRLV